MNYRNPIYTAGGQIDCEIEHPEFGWIPFTASPEDQEEHGRLLFAEIVESGDVAPAPAPDLDAEKARQLRQLNDDYEAAAQPLIKEYPPTERLGWDKQLNEATRYREWQEAGGTGDAPPTPALDGILKGRNGTDGTETLASLVDAVLVRAEAFVQWQEYTGIRHRGERLIKEATTVEAVRSVTWVSLTNQ